VAVIVEGYMDALAAHQHGFHNVVASLGTALTDYQFKQLQKLASKIVLALDPDAAGIRAMLRGLDVARATLEHTLLPIFEPGRVSWIESKFKIEVRILALPGDKDPDEIMESDPAQWRTLVDQAPHVIEFLIDTLSAGRDLNDPKEKASLANEVLPLIRNIADRVEQDVYTQLLARRIGVEPTTLLQQIRSTAGASARAHGRPEAAPETPKHDTTDLEQYTLSLLLRHPHVVNVIDEALKRAELPALNVDDFEQVACREIFRALRTALIDDPAPMPDEVRAVLDTALYPHVAALAKSSMNDRRSIAASA
jgi:DNA primase